MKKIGENCYPQLENPIFPIVYIKILISDLDN